MEKKLHQMKKSQKFPHENKKSHASPYLEIKKSHLSLQCRDIGYELHEELMRVLRELHATTKTYLSYQAEARAAETKLRATEAARAKVEQSLPKEKLEKSKKYRVVEKEVQKVSRKSHLKIPIVENFPWSLKKKKKSRKSREGRQVIWKLSWYLQSLLKWNPWEYNWDTQE